MNVTDEFLLMLLYVIGFGFLGIVCWAMIVMAIEERRHKRLEQRMKKRE